MYRYVDNVRSGLLEPLSFKLAECTKRSCNLQLSKLIDVESTHSSGINTLDADNDNGSYLLSGCVDGSIYMHNLCNYTGSPHYTCKMIYKIDKNSRHAHSYSVETIQWYPFDTGIFITSGMDKILKIWDTNEMEPAECIKFKGRIFQHHLCPVPSSTSCLIAAATTVNQALLVDIRTGSNAHELRGHTSSVLSCKWSPSAQHLLATGSADNRIMLWDVRATKNCLKVLDQNNGKGRSSNEQSFTAHDGSVNGLCFTRNGLFLLSFGTDSRLRLWNVSTGENEMINYGCISNDTRKSAQLDVSACTNKDLVYIPSEGNIFIYSVYTGVKIKTLPGHFNTVNCCYFHPFNIQLYSGGNDRIILCWTDETVESDFGDCKEVENVIENEWSSDEEDNPDSSVSVSSSSSSR